MTIIHFINKWISSYYFLFYYANTSTGQTHVTFLKNNICAYLHSFMNICTCQSLAA